jgi:hypothetical protein
LRSQCRTIGYLLPIALAAVLLHPSKALAQKATETVAYAPPTLSLTADPSVITACSEGNGSQVRLNASAVSPGGNPIRYHWSTASGHINGDGAVVTWDLSGLAPGYHKASLEIETGDNAGECQAFSTATVLITPCPPPRPVCPNVSITCPTNITMDQPLTFNAIVSGGTPSVTPVYNWTVSAGTIIEGQGTSSIRVDTTGMAGETVRATLAMGGYTLDCSASCSVQIPVPKIVSRKFDEFADINRNDEKARLDNYAVELQNDPKATAYVVVYPGHSGKVNDAQKRAARIVDYLVNSRVIDAQRIITLIGGAKEGLMVDLWIVPQGATPPTP